MTVFGMTVGEAGLVAFIFGLVWVAAFVPRVGAYVGRKLAPGPHGEAGPTRGGAGRDG